MAEEVSNLSVEGTNPFIYNQILRCFEGDNVNISVTTHQDPGLRIEFNKKKEEDFIELIIHVPFWKDIEDCGVKEYIKEQIGDILQETSVKGANLALRITKEDYKQKGIDFVKKVASIQQYILGAPFYHYFTALSQNNTSLKPKILSFFDKEALYIIPKPSQTCVVFSINEEDDTDRSLMQVFLLELSEAKRVVAGGPSVNYSKEEPVEIKGVSKGEKAGVGYLVFSFNKDHVTEDKVVQAANMIGIFRYYLDYHIKSTKTYLHTRMRNRAEKWKNLLNEAHFEEDTVQWKKASGKTFVK